ncbi:hypothetical protein CTAYLR_008702 [Chrysophaeum taylorii]|uniref:BING4 C-terminal domain-containing protein n=1 Tax=Chrysophaeum taylorii TaxID=2483200 RepID=A0AAD7XLD7_9STRA|nr:hypothetical protein CTAYLR_008702 [Chrysophaeum taylorii]
MTAEVSVASKRNAWRFECASVRNVKTTENGRFAVLATGEDACVLDLARQTVVTRAGEDVRDATLLHDETMLATAQRKYVYIYDKQGTEVHRLNEHIDPDRLEFLRYHFLLASCGRAGMLKYHDASIGRLVSEHRATKRASCSSVNPQNATILLGHDNGVVSFWSPAQPKALAKVLCHRGSVSAVAVAFDGRAFATASHDGTVRFWDLRSFARPVHRIDRAATTLAFSHRGLLAIGSTSGVDVYDDPKPRLFKPYVSHKATAPVQVARFRPFEDALLLGHAAGCDSILVPGSAEPNYDSLEGQNPYRAPKARRSLTVRALLDKLPPETISLDDFLVGKVARDPAQLEKDRLALLEEANSYDKNKDGDAAAEKRDKKKTRGRSKLAAKLRKKAKNVISQETLKLREKLRQERDAARHNNNNKKKKRAAPDALAAASSSSSKRRPSTALDRLLSSNSTSST